VTGAFVTLGRGLSVHNTWLETALRTYTANGFFKGRAGSIEELAADLNQQHHERWGEDLGPLPGQPQLSEVLVLSYDSDRTWWQDTEADVCDGNGVYAEVLEQWAAISLGSFRPARVAERWATADGPIAVTLELDGRPRSLAPRVLDDYLDMGILASIDGWLAESRAARRAATLETGDQTAFVTFLTAEERSRIQADRGIRFGPDTR
jgi:hypothetical protein